jgi:hypothetical protein
VAFVAVTAGVLATAQLASAGTFFGQHHKHYPYQQSSSPDTSVYQPGGTSSQPPVNSAGNTVIPGTTGTPVNTATAAFTSSHTWASYSADGYTIHNNEWGNGYGSQTLWVNSATNWGVTSTQPHTSGVKSYPNTSKSIGTPLDSLSSATSSFSENVPSVGDWESAYDIWLNGSGYEVMVWTYKNGNVGPLGSPVGTVNLNGNTWTLYAGNNGSNPTYSFVPSSNQTSGTVNILGLLKYLENTMGYFSNPTLSTIQYGFEITSTDNTPQNFAITNYSASAS